MKIKTYRMNMDNGQSIIINIDWFTLSLLGILAMSSQVGESPWGL